MDIRNAKKAVMFAWKKLMCESLDLLFSSILLLFFNQYVSMPCKLVALVTSHCPPIFPVAVAEAWI